MISGNRKQQPIHEALVFLHQSVNAIICVGVRVQREIRWLSSDLSMTSFKRMVFESGRRREENQLIQVVMLEMCNCHGATI